MPKSDKETLTIETSSLKARILNDHVVLVQAKHGVEVTPKASKEIDQFIIDGTSGNYGIIIDRVEDHSVVPIDMFEVLNKIPTLYAIAIVVHKSSSMTAAEIDRMLFNRELEIFTSIEEAKAWVEMLLKDVNSQAQPATHSPKNPEGKESKHRLSLEK